MIRIGRRSPSPDTSECFLGLSLDVAGTIADRVVSEIFADDPSEPFDEEHTLRSATLLAGITGLRGEREALRFLAAVNGTARMLGYVEWRAIPADRRPERHATRRQDVADALLIHLHGAPGSSPARLHAERYREHALLYRRGWRGARPPDHDRLRNYARAEQERAGALREYVDSIRPA